MARKLLNLRRDDTCSQCSRPVTAGTQAYWHTPERVVVCLSCSTPTQQPGRSAREISERKRERREAHARQDYGRVGAFVARHSRGPQHERAWAQGAAGEEENARRLEKRLAETPVVLLHDRRVPGSRANIDHIAIGPRGVTVIDSKNMKGRVKIDWRGGLFSPRKFDLYINGRRQTRLVHKVEGQIAVVAAVLRADGYESIPVFGALCMANVDGLPLFRHPALRGIPIEGTRHIATLVASPGPVSADEIRSIAATIDRGLPPA